MLAAAKDLRTRSFGAATAKYRELGTLANLLAFNALSTLPTRNFQAATFDGAPALAAEELAELRGTARNSCASCTAAMDSRAGCVPPVCTSASGDSTASNREEATGDLRDEPVVGIGHGFEQLLDPLAAHRRNDAKLGQ